MSVQTISHKALPLVGRTLLAALFIAAGLSKIADPAGTSASQSIV
jgi:uncharacterized membrane protein YphA (DoxX/SURF4 family)